MAERSYETTTFVEECNRLKLVPEVMNKLEVSIGSGRAAVKTERPNSERIDVRWPVGGSVMRFVRWARP